MVYNINLGISYVWIYAQLFDNSNRQYDVQYTIL